MPNERCSVKLQHVHPLQKSTSPISAREPIPDGRHLPAQALQVLGTVRDPLQASASWHIPCHRVRLGAT